MYQVVDSNGTVLEKDFPTKKLAKEFRDQHPGAMTQRMACHPKGASHLPPPPKPKFNVPQATSVHESAEPVKLTDEEIEAEVAKYDIAQTANGGIPIWKQRPIMAKPITPACADDDPTFM